MGRYDFQGNGINGKCPYCGNLMPVPDWKYCDKRICRIVHRRLLEDQKEEKHKMFIEEFTNLALSKQQ